MPVAYRTVLTINNHLKSDLYDVDPQLKIGSIDDVLPDYIRSGNQQTVYISTPGSFAGSSGKISYKTHSDKRDREEILVFEFKCVFEEASFVKFSSTMPNELVVQVEPYGAEDHPLYGEWKAFR